MSIKKELSGIEIVLYALYLLGGWQKRIHTEDIAMKCFNLTPSKFSWTKYPNIPDLTPARFALESAKKKIYGSLVEGESERKKSVLSIGGWRLTTNGVNWIRNNQERIENILGKHKQIGNRLVDNRRLNNLIKSQAFRKYLTLRENADISHSEFAESLICTVNTDPKILNERLEQIFITAGKLNKYDIIGYVNYCKSKFHHILGLS